MASVSIHPPKTPVTKGSSGLAAATTPNVCKMPGPPAPFVPTPLPNIGKSGDSPKGYSTSVKIEGNYVAIKGASFGSMGDIASKGTGGGLLSSNTHGPTKFAGPGSMSVKIEGKNVHLLGDPMLNNCGPSGSPANAATLAGLLQVPNTGNPPELDKIAKECQTKIENEVANGKKNSKGGNPSCATKGVWKHTCCKEKLDSKEHSYDNVVSENNCGSTNCRLDVAIITPPIPKMIQPADVTDIFDFKFPCKGQAKMSKTQLKKYNKVFPGCPIKVVTF